MADTNDDIKWLYGKLKSKGYDIGSEQEFSSSLANEDDRKWYYEKAKGMGLDMGSMDDFNSLYAPKPQQQRSSVAASSPLSEQRRAELMRQTGNMMAGVSAGGRRAENRMEFAKENFGFKVRPVKIGQNSSVVETRPEYDANAGGMRPRYLTESGNEFTDRGQADLEQNAVDRYKYSQTVDGQLAAAEAEKERLDGLMRERMEELDGKRGTLGDIVRTLADESHGMPGGVVNAGGMNRYRSDERFLQLEAAARKNNLAIQTLRDKKAGKMNDFWHSVGTALTNGYTFSDGLSDMSDASALMSAQRRLEEINRKRESGEALTKEEEAAEAVLRNAAVNETVQGMYGGDYGAWSRAGNMFATSVDMMKDILLTPGATGLTKSVARNTASALGKNIAKVAGEKVAGNMVTKGILKGTGILVGTSTGGALVSNTAGLGHTMGEMGKELSGRVEIDGKGNYKIEDQSGLLDAFVEAERRQIGETGSEMFGEFIPGMGGVLKRGLEKIGLSKISGALTNIGKRDWYKRYSKLLEAGGYNGLPGEALEEYEGLLFDAMTGNAGEVWEQVKDPKTHVDIWLGCLTMGALMGSVPMVVQGAHTAQYYRYKHGTKVADRVASYRMTPEVWEPLRERIDNSGNGEMTDVVMSIFEDSDLHEEEKRAALDYVRNLQRMRGYNIAQANNADEEKNPEVEAVNDSYSEGHGAAEILATGMGEEHSEEEIEAARADVDAIKIRMQEAYDVINDAFGWDAEYYLSRIEAPELSERERDAEMWSLLDDPQLTEDQREAVLYYINARAALDGVMDASAEVKESKRAEVEESVRKRTHKDSGVIIPATMKVDDRQVYIVKGDVVMFSDGTDVDVRNSSESVVVMDAETGKYQFASPDQFSQVSEAVNPQDELEAAYAVIEQEQMNIFGDNAVVPEESATAETPEMVSGVENVQQTALARIPLSESGEPMFEQAESADIAWDALVEFSDGDAVTAKEVADMMVEEKRKALEKAQKLKPSGRTPSEIIASKREIQAELERTEGEYRRWLEMSNVETHRESEALMERRRIEKEELERRRAEEERLRAEREEAERRRIEELNGVPDVSEDTPRAARARGFRRVEGHRVDRQEPVERIDGKEVRVKFSSKESVPGRVAVIEAAALQPSHIQGLRNPAHFIDEAQPKERTDEVSVMSARGIAEDIRPEEITGSVTAYMGAPTVNERGEVIQGNNRGDALRFMWEARKEQAEKYRGYLVDHAEEFGLRRDELEKMERPVLVNMIPVEDGDAIRLGQYVAGDTESGGLERIKPKNVVKRLGDEMRTFAKMLLRSEDEGVSFAGLVDSNGEEVMDWLLKRGFISQTQYASAFDSRGSLTAEAKNDLRGMMYQGIFEGGNIRLEEKFNRLPAKAQRALLATAWRDNESLPGSSMIGEIQESILAFDALMEHEAFANARNWKEARSAVDGWKMQYVMDDVSGESYLPGERFSDFALHLAAMYKGEKQSLIQRVFNDMYDLIQGSREETLFEKPDNTPRSLVEAVKEVLNIEYNGKRRDDILVVGSEDGQGGGRGRDGDVASGERAEDGGEPLERGGGVEGDSRGVGERRNLQSSERRSKGETSEIDENGLPFVVSENGTTSFGEIREESGLTSAPIKLSEGYQDENGKGYGLRHIEAGHGDEIRNAGFSTVEEFVSYVAKNYDEDNIRVGKQRRNGNTTYLIQVTDSHDNTLFVELSRDGSYWNVNSGGVFRKGYSNKKETVAKTEPQQPNNAVSSDSSLSTDEQSGTSSIEPNGESTVSDGKDNTLSSDKQTDGAESGEPYTITYTITPTSYTNKRGKTSDVHLVKFNRELTAEEKAALDTFSREPLTEGKKTSRGWYDRKQGGYMMRSEEAARQLAEMIGNEEAVADAQPMTAEELREAVTPKDNIDSNAPANTPRPKKAPINRVSLEDVMTDLSTKGESQLSDHAEPVKAEQEVQHEISDDEMQSLANELRDLLGIGEDEGAAGIKFRDPGELTPKERQRIQSAGIRLAMGLVERGTTSFADYATKMVGLLGDKIRPWLKSFYEGARWTPGYENIAFTPSEEVARFDVENFDKRLPDPIAQAAMIVEERKASAASVQAQKELTEIRNNKRKKQDEQTSADTAALTSKAEAVAGKAESIAETSEDTAELNRAGEEIDQTIEEINDQLALLGYYEAVEDDAKFHGSYGYMLTAEKKAVADATKLAKQLVNDLGIDIKVTSATTPLGRKNVKKGTAVRANLAPAGGDVIINLPLNEGRQLAIYIGLDPVHSRGGNSYKSGYGYGDNLEVNGIMYRVENPEGKGMERYGDNMYAPVESTYAYFLSRIKEITREYLPEEKSVDERQESHNGYNIGDEVLWDRYGNGKWEKVKIEDFDADGSPIFEAIKGIMSEKGDWSRVKPADGIFGEAQRVARAAQEKKKTATPARKKTAVKPEQPVGDLFGGLFDEPISNEKKTDVQSRPGTAERERGHEPQQNEPLGESQRNEVKGTDGGGMVGRDNNNPLSNRERGAGVSELHQSERGISASHTPDTPQNTRNNHAERGVDYAPKGEDARIKANIDAIELAKRLLDAGETATPEQMEILRKFSGWGGLGKAFNDNQTSKRLREILTPEEYEAAVMSRNSAYYTPAPVIDAMWDVARALGFKGGNVLEGSAGIGNIIGLMPTEISERSNIHAVEIDNTTGGILSLLYPDAKVEVQGFERTKVRNNSVDLAITNVPFITGQRVFDETGDKDLSKKFKDIHDFCIAKNIRKLREGGIGIFITSSGTLDNSKELRRWITNEGNADVIGAFRMHNKTFGGTGATSDIIVVRKRVNGKPSPNAIDVAEVTGVRVADYDTGDTRKVKGQEIPIIKPYSMTYNKYFAEHPENMAGEMLFNFERGETRYPTSRALFPSADKPQEKMLSEWVARFADMEEEAPSTGVEEEVTRINEKLGEGVKEGSMVLNSQGELCMARMGEAVPLGLNKNKVKGHTKAECFEDYTAIKKALSDVLEYQSAIEDNAGLEPLLKELNRVFDVFTKKYGNLHKNPAISFLRNDVDFSSIMALETYSERGDKKGNKVVKVGKTDIFSRRVIETEKDPQPTTIKDGILASLYKSGGIDVDYISQALGKSADEVKQEIVKSGLGYEHPSTGAMEVSYQYLSGNVREKLHIAQENNEDGRYDANIAALEKVIPMNIPAHLIEFTLGSSWIDPKLYEDFVYDKTGINVKLTNVGGTWFMKTPRSTFNEKNRAMAVTSKICDKTIMGHELIEAAITNRQITVSKQVKHYDGTTETISDKAATAECSTRIDEIRSEFKDWARERMHADAEMSARIEETYNEQFNNYVPMSIPDEFVPEHFGGQVTELHGKPFALRPHQGRAVVRGTTEPILLAHEVGTGKTYTLITTAMEMRRLGTARKPMIVVQNATVGQFVESAKEIYPNAKVLTIEEADRTAEGRKNFYAKIKYNDWDMIVVPQSVFERIPDSPEREMAYIQDIIEEKMKVLEAMREADDGGRSMIVRQAEKELEEQRDRLAELTEAIEGKKKKRDEKKEATTRQNAEVRAMEMLDREVDDVENFDDMGIDAILVDEAHEYKHLGFATAMQRGVKGVDPSFSKKSQGVYLKTQAVMERNHGRNVVFATGTPISNTAAEIWTFMRYLMPADQMKAYNIFYFDDFVRNFGNLAQMVEFKTNGKFAEVNRFAGYVNLPELVRIWSGVADTVLTREAGGVSDKIPEMEGGKPNDIYLPQTRALRSVMKYVKAELDRYDKMTGKEKKENSHIPLTMYGIAKAAAVDARLVIADAEDDPNSKTNATVRETLRSLNESAKYKGTVAIFSDNYQNKRSGFNLYEEIRNKLIAEGVPAEQIVVIKPGMTVKKKLDIFDKVNAGEVRVVLGSTFTLGTGVNIQERLHTLIHVDAPNRPMDYTQRNGRAMRQGNLHKDMGIPVRIIRFGVEDSLDVTAYQRLKTKGAIADSIMNGSKMMQNSMENRVLEEEEDTFGDMTAQLSGSEYAILKNQAEREVRNLTAKQKGHDIDQIYVHNQLPQVEGFIKGAQRRIEIETKNLEIIGKHFPDGTLKKITIGKLSFDSVKGMEDFFKEQNAKMNEAAETIREGAENWTSRLTIDVDGLPFEVTTTVTREVDRNGQGTLSFEPERKVTYSCEALGIKDRTVKGNRIKNVMQEIAERIVPGTESRELLSRGQNQLAHYSEGYRQLQERNGREFPFKQQLAEAKERLAKYEEAMKKELEEKEAKYAEMDKAVDAATDISLDDDEDVDVEAKFRDGDSDGERLRAIRALEPIEVEPNNMSRAELREVYDNLPTVDKDGREIEFYRSAFKKNYRDGGLFGQIVPVLDEVLEQSVLAYSEVDNLGGVERSDGTIHKAHPNFDAFDNYIGKVRINSKDYYVRTTVKVQPGQSGAHSVFVTNVEVYEKTADGQSLPKFPSGESNQQRSNETSDDVVDAKLQHFFEKASSEALELDKTDRVNELSEKLGGSVKIISDKEDIDNLPSARHRRSKGWFDSKTGEVVVVLPNNVNVADVDNTVVHEVVGHKGLRALIGEERFEEFVGEVYDHASDSIRKVIDRMTDRMVSEEADRLRVRKAQAHEREGEDVNANYYTDMAEARIEAEQKREEYRREATEEYLADMAGRIGDEGFEKMSRDELTLWGKIKARVQAFLDKFLRGLKIAKSIRLTDKDLAYILYKSWKNLRDSKGRGGVFSEAEDAVMRMRTGYGESKLRPMTNAEKKSFFKSKKSASQRAMSLITESPHLTSVTDGLALNDGAKLPKFFDYPTSEGEEMLRFRDGDLGLEEYVTKMKAEAMQANAGNLQAKRDAMRAIGGNLNKLRSAMARQKEYDLTTVKSITDLAKILLGNNLLDDLSKYETKRILSTVNSVVGKQDVSQYVQKVMDIMVDNQLRMGANTFGRLLSIKGSRVDARGIEVQGELDPDGQRIAQVVKKSVSLPKDYIGDRIAEALNRMGSSDQTIADEAAIEYAGLQVARQFVEDITESKAEERELRDSLKQAKEDYDAGTMSKAAYKQYVDATNDAIRQNKIERAEAYNSLVGQMSSVLGESVERAKAWREAEKHRVEEIHHNANSDMEGRPTDEHHKDGRVQSFVNNSAMRFLLAPLGTFDQMLRMFGSKNARGEGYLWNRYMRGWVDATEKEYLGYRDALKVLDDKVSEVYGKKMSWGDLFTIDRKLPKATVNFWDGGEYKDHELTQGNLLYIYMADKMSDGRMKLRRMGITEEDVEDIENFLDPKFLELADWMQEEFLVDKRNEYNEVHKRMFGASMAAIENYFPLKILANARLEEVDVADDTTDTALPSTSTGSIIKRRRNNLALDVTGANAFSVILDHIQQMERWAAFAEFNRDLNTLLSYKRFRNQVMNMSSIYGGGKTLWNNFRNVCSMAAGAYRPPIAALDKAAVNIAKGVTAAKVSFRLFTALKQFLSMPAYISDSNPLYLARNIMNPVGAWKWSMENLPIFEKRWKSRMAGDPRLMKTEMDWKAWRSNVVQIASRIGMSPNAFVDALTVSIGAHAMYETRLNKYLRQGYEPEAAEKRAKQDATILFNQTQQSSEGAFLSTMQVDRSWLSVLFTVFRNSSMSYTRQLYDAVRNLKHIATPGYKGISEEFMAKQMRRDGIDPDKADANAKSEYRREILRDIVRIGIFGYALQLAWNLGAYIPYLLLGDDGDEKDKMWGDVMNHTMFGSIEGLTGGDVMSAAGQMWMNGDSNWSYLVKDMPLASDVSNILKKFPKDQAAAMNDVINLLVQSGIGVNPQSLTDAVVAVIDACGDDAETSRECALLIARIINCPPSQIDKIYFDELDMSGEEASKLTLGEIAERYADYKMMREAPLTGWLRSEETTDSIRGAKEKKVFKVAKEKIGKAASTEQTRMLLEEYDAVAKRETEINKLKKTDREAYRNGRKELRETTDMRKHNRIKLYKRDMKELTEKYQNAKSAEERDEVVQQMFRARDKMLEDVASQMQQ